MSTTVSSSPPGLSSSSLPWDPDGDGTITTIRSSRIVGSAIVIGGLIIILCILLIILKIVTSIRHLLRSRRRAKLQKTSRDAGGFYRDDLDGKRGSRKAMMGGGNAIDAWEWEGSAN